MQRWCFIYPLDLLAKAFFYARARSLLVSNWTGSLEATIKLVTRIFENVANHNSIGKPKILRKLEKMLPRKHKNF
jgi:CHAT domain-containing protein